MNSSILIIVFGPLLAAIVAGLGNRAIGNVPVGAGVKPESVPVSARAAE